MGKQSRRRKERHRLREQLGLQKYKHAESPMLHNLTELTHSHHVQDPGTLSVTGEPMPPSQLWVEEGRTDWSQRAHEIDAVTYTPRAYSTYLIGPKSHSTESRADEFKKELDKTHLKSRLRDKLEKDVYQIKIITNKKRVYKKLEPHVWIIPADSKRNMDVNDTDQLDKIATVTRKDDAEKSWISLLVERLWELRINIKSLSETHLPDGRSIINLTIEDGERTLRSIHNRKTRQSQLVEHICKELTSADSVSIALSNGRTTLS